MAGDTQLSVSGHSLIRGCGGHKGSWGGETDKEMRVLLKNDVTSEGCTRQSTT